MNISRRIWQGAGVDLLLGGAGNDILHPAGQLVAADRSWAVDKWPDPVGEIVFNNFTGNLFDSDTQGDVAYGGAGHDKITGGQSDDVFYGESGNDTLHGNGGKDVLFGGSGVDVLQGGNDDDILLGGGDKDYLFGDGFSTVPGVAGNDTLDGGSGDDHLEGGGGNDTLLGGDDNDILLGEVGEDYLYGGAGTDQLVGGLGADVLDGGDGADTIFRDEFDTVIAGSGDTIGYATGGSIILNDLALADLIDRYVTSEGISVPIDGDVIVGEDQSSIARNTKHPTDRDLLTGTPNNDLLFGESGNDLLKGGAGQDVLHGGAGNDLYRIGANDDRDTLIDQDGANTVLLADIPVKLFVRPATGGDYRSLDGRFTATAGTDLTLTDTQGSARAVLKNYADGDFGIRLLTLTPDPVTTHEILGDRKNKDFDARADAPYATGGQVLNPGFDAWSLPAGSTITFVTAEYTKSDGTTGYWSVLEGPLPDFAVPGTLNPANGLPYTFENYVYPFTLIAAPGTNNYYATGYAHGIEYRIDPYTADPANGIRGNFVADPDRPAPGRADVLYGGAEGDHLVGKDGGDKLYGRGGDDYIEAGIATPDPNYITDQDYVEGGAGRDVIEGGADSDILQGGDDDDRLYANLKGDYDTIFTPGQTPTLDHDWLNGGNGEDLLVGSRGDDGLTGGGGRDVILGGAGDDNIFGDRDSVAQHTGWSYNEDPVTHDREFLFITDNPNAAAGGDDVIHGGDGKDWILGEAGNDLIFGEDGDDLIDGDSGGIDPALHGHDVLSGGKGRDILVGGGGDDVLLGGENDDTLTGDGSNLVLSAHGRDTLDGGAGDDYLYGNGGDDLLDGGANLDYLFGGDGNDTLTGGAGNDYIYGGAGRDTYLFNAGDGIDTVYDPDPAALNTIVFGPGVDPNNLHLHLGSLAIEYGQGDVVHFQGFNPDDATTPFSFSEIEFSDGGTLRYEDLIALGFDLDGSAADDTITGTNVVDRIRGGAGNDSLYGGQGDDTYIFNVGDGQDLIDESSGLDALRFGPGILPTDLTLTQSGTNLLVTRNASTDQVIVKDWYANAAAQVESIQFADGTVWDRQAIMQQAQAYVAFNTDTLADAGTAATAYSLVLGPEVANGFAITVDDAGGNDKLTFEAILLTGAPPELGPKYIVPVLEGSSRDANDLVLTVFLRSDIVRPDVRGTVRIANYYGAGEIETLEFPGGHTLSSENAVSLVPGTYISTYITWPLYERFSPNSSYYGVMSMLFAGGEGNDTLTGMGAMSNGSYYYGNGGDDVLIGTTGRDLLHGGVGNDTMYGGQGADTYYIASADVDTIFDDSRGEAYVSHDTLRVPDGAFLADLTFARDGNDLLVGNTRIQRYFEPDAALTANGKTYPFLIERLEGNGWFIDLPRHLVSLGLFGMIAGTAGDDSLHGDLYNNTLQGLDGNDTLRGYAGADRIEGGAGNDTLYGGGTATLGLDEADALDGGTGNDWLEGHNGSDTLLGGAGDDWLRGDFFFSYPNNTATVYAELHGRDVLDGGTGNDWLIGDQDGDTYHIYHDGGLDVINEIGVNRYSADVAQLDTELAGLQGYTGATYANWYWNEIFTPGKEGSRPDWQWIPADIQTMLATLAAGVTPANASTILTTLRNFLIEDQTDVVAFGPGVTLQNIQVEWNDGVLYTDAAGAEVQTPGLLGIDLGNGKGVAIRDDRGGHNFGIEIFRFADGTELRLAQVMALDQSAAKIGVQVGTAGNDTLVGSFYSDEAIYGYGGDDTLDGRGGSEILYGGAGNDTYIFGRGYGPDSVVDADAGNRLQFSPGVALADVEVYFDGVDFLQFLVKDTGDVIDVADWGANRNYPLASVQYGDGTLQTTASLNMTAYRGTALADVLTGSSGDDRLYGLGGNDTLNGGRGKDLLDGGTGNDLLKGDVGNDTYLFSDTRDAATGLLAGWGSDIVADVDKTSGNTDTLAFGSGTQALDLVLSRSGNDLRIARHLATDSVTVQGWYGGTNNQVEVIKSSTGATLLNTKVDQLIQAMATFSANNGGISWDQAITQNPNEVQAVLTAYWQSAA